MHKVYHYGYDILGQLTNASARLPNGDLWDGYQFSYAYDLTGNPLEQNRNGLVYSNSFNTLNQNVETRFAGALAALGNYTSPLTATVSVNNVQAKLFNDEWAAAGIPFVQGTNTLVTTILDLAGRTTSTTTSVTVADRTYAYDAMGNIILATSSDGSVAGTYHYTPFGRPIAQSAPYRPRFLFSSKEYDPETSLIFYGLRFYNPAVGRWLSRDLLRENGGVNLYIGIANHPTGVVDYFGLCPSPEGCRVHYFYTRIDEKGVGTRFLADMTQRILAEFPCAEVVIEPLHPAIGTSMRDARKTADAIAIVGHGERFPLRPPGDLIDPIDFTTQLSGVQNPDFPEGFAPSLEMLFPESIRPSDSTLDCVILGTCNNGYAPEHLPDGTPVVRILPNVHDHPVEKNSLPRPDWDFPDYFDEKEKRNIPGATQTVFHWEYTEAAIVSFLRTHCCCQ